MALRIDIRTSGGRTASLSKTGGIDCKTSALMQDFGTNHRASEVWQKTLTATMRLLWDQVDSDPWLLPRPESRPAKDALFLQGLMAWMAGLDAEGYAWLALQTAHG